MTQSVPLQPPVSTGAGVALPSWMVQTMRPCSVCITADCGTRKPWACPAITCALTNCPGSTVSSGLANSARNCTVPRLPSTVEPAKFSRPVPASGLPSALTSLTCVPLWARSWACSDSENEKRTQIGSVCTTVVSRPSAGDTRLPSDLRERPLMPEIGALTTV